MLSCFRGICQVAPMSRLRFFVGKYNLLKLRIDLKTVLYIPICCLNPHFFFLFLFMLELCCRIFSARDVFLGHGSFSWITQSSMFIRYFPNLSKSCLWFHSLVCILNFVSISCVFFISPYCSGKTRTDTSWLSWSLLSIVDYLSIFTSTSFLLATHIVILTNCSAG